jgi:hypothetical protein
MTRFNTRPGLLVPVLLMVMGLFTAVSAASAHEDSPGGRVPLPNMKTYRGEKCVEPESVMRRRHFEFILHERNLTMHEGIRTRKFSLKNCVDCHANPKTNSVLGKNGFCSSCHEYAAVDIDCFSCHSDKPEKKSAATTAVNPHDSKVISTSEEQR